jgi:hypothetical protein
LALSLAACSALLADISDEDALMPYALSSSGSPFVSMEPVGFFDKLGAGLGKLGGVLSPNSEDPAERKRQQQLNVLLNLGLGTLGASQQQGASLGSSIFGGFNRAQGALQAAGQQAFESQKEKRQQEREDRLEKSALDQAKLAEQKAARESRDAVGKNANSLSKGLSTGNAMANFNLLKNTPEAQAVFQQYGIDPDAITTPDQVKALSQQLGQFGGLTSPPERDPGEPLEAIIGPNGQPVLRPRSQASGATPYYRPSNALAVTLPDGTVISDGPPSAVGPNELTKPTVNKLQESIVGATDRLDRLNQTLTNYKPEFLQARGLLKAKSGELTEFLGGDLDPESKKYLEEYSEFKAAAANDFNATLRELSGAAVTDGEAKRALQAAPSPDDRSPTQFEAKARSTTKTIRRAILRANYALKNGIGTKSIDELSKMIPLDAVDAIYESRANQIHAELGGTAETRAEAIRRANQEFGLAR